MIDSPLGSWVLSGARQASPAEPRDLREEKFGHPCWEAGSQKHCGSCLWPWNRGTVDPRVPSSNCCPPTLARPEKSLQKDRNKETQAHRNGHSSVRQRTGNRIKGRCAPEGWGDLLPGAPPTPTITHGQIENSRLWKLFSVFSTWLFWYGWYLWKVSLCVRSRGHWGCTCSEFTKQVGLC